MNLAEPIAAAAAIMAMCASAEEFAVDSSEWFFVDATEAEPEMPAVGDSEWFFVDATEAEPEMPAVGDSEWFFVDTTEAEPEPETPSVGCSEWFFVDTTEPIEPTLFALTVKPNSTKYGTVTGSGTYEIGMKATIKATANNGYVFAGWYTDKACTKALNPKGYDNRKPTVKVVMPAKSTTIYAKFVTKDGDKSALKFKSATKKLAKTPAKATAGEAFSLKLGVSSASLPTFTAKGLPKGLSIDKTTGEITGVGTVPGSYTATVTAKSAAGNKITQKVKITVNVPSWAKGTFYGLAYPGVKSEDSWAYLKFTAAEAGKVSGKVTYNGKSYSFTSSYKSCTAKKATFSPKIKIGSKTFKPGTVTVKTQNVDGLQVVAATDKNGFVTAQKKPGLVKKGKPLAALVGERLTFTKKDANSGLLKTKDTLVVALGNDDAVTVSGVVGGKKFAPISWVALVADPHIESWSVNKPAYTLYVDIIDAALKYERTLVLQVYFDNDGQPRVNAKFQ